MGVTQKCELCVSCDFVDEQSDKSNCSINNLMFIFSIFLMKWSKYRSCLNQKEKMCLCLVLFPGIHYKKIRVAIATFSLA